MMKDILTFVIIICIIVEIFGGQNHNNNNIKIYSGFNRTCKRSPDCNFIPDNSNSFEKVWLLCENYTCICDRNIYIPYAKSWGLKWDGKQCTIGKNGPCGESDGLTIGCHIGLTCNNESKRCYKITTTTTTTTTGVITTTTSTTTTNAPSSLTTSTFISTTTLNNTTDSSATSIQTTLDSIPTTITTIETTNPPIILSSSSPLPFYNDFNRICEKSNDCQFKSFNGSNDIVWLTCSEDNECICSKYLNFSDDMKDFDVYWNGTNCNIGLGGPCGEDNGLKINCNENNLICIEGICRISVPNSIQMDQPCHEDEDCQIGLFCKIAGFHFEPIKHCVY